MDSLNRGAVLGGEGDGAEQRPQLDLQPIGTKSCPRYHRIEANGPSGAVLLWAAVAPWTAAKLLAAAPHDCFRLRIQPVDATPRL